MKNEAHKYKYKDEFGKAFHAARDAYLAELPQPSQIVSRRYHRFKGVLIYLVERKKMSKQEIDKIKIADLPERMQKSLVEQ